MKTAKTNTVTLNGRAFELREPDYGIVLRVLNVVGNVGLRAESTVRAALANPTDTSLIFGVLAAMRPEDVLRLGSAVLQCKLTSTSISRLTWRRPSKILRPASPGRRRRCCPDRRPIRPDSRDRGDPGVRLLRGLRVLSHAA